MSKVDSLYHNAVDSMTPCEKIGRSIGMFNWSREFIGRQIKEANPELDPARLKLLVALKMYGGNDSIRTLIERLLANVSD